MEIFINFFFPRSTLSLLKPYQMVRFVSFRTQESFLCGVGPLASDVGIMKVGERVSPETLEEKIQSVCETKEVRQARTDVRLQLSFPKQQRWHDASFQ